MARYAMDITAEAFQPGVVGTVALTGEKFAASPARMEAVACAKAEQLLVEGQIGIYAETIQGPFLGYAIRYRDQPAYFEPAEDEVA